ncbi:AP-1 complex subunit mu-2 [Tubulinosema ratisbonensis]|uniref:AP-1 complex subunit mu-2 n=1 Tax=Tubulinosema ratisbonensis TaxID=291195 RepID=A0A437AL86_9MICR|nr:AP-1 complex subunit mu-2 [Tubulinosema ratisbonensis]
MIEEISILTENNILLLGTTRPKNITFPIEQQENGKIMVTKKINNLKILLILSKYTPDQLYLFNQLKLPKNLDEKMVKTNYFKYFSMLQSLKIKLNLKEDTKILPFTNILKIKENIFRVKEFFIDVVEEFRCVVDCDLNVYSCSVFGNISYKSFIGKLCELKIFFECCEGIRFFGGQNVFQKDHCYFFHVRMSDGKSELCKYVVNEVNPPLFIKKLSDGYELLPKLKLTNVKLKIPLPLSAYSVSFDVSIGKARQVNDFIEWDIRNLEELGAKITLKISTLQKENVNSNIIIQFTNKNSKNTNLRIKSVQSTETKIVSYAKHEIKSEDYEIRIN